MKVAGLALALTLTGTAALAEPPDGRFVVYNGTISDGTDGGTKASIMVDSETGQSWMLAWVGNRLVWAPLVYSLPIPENTLPPPPT